METWIKLFRELNAEYDFNMEALADCIVQLVDNPDHDQDDATMMVIIRALVAEYKTTEE